MRRLTVGLLGLSLAGCFQPTWKPLRPGEALRPDTVILVGSFTSDPPIQQHGIPRACAAGTWVNGHYEPAGKVVFVQETDGNVMAFFTPDLAERFSAKERATPSRYDWTYMPVSGHFFVEIPRTPRVQLRGFTYLTNVGSRMFELPATVDLAPNDRVVYVGEIRIHRGGGRRAEFVNAVDGARRAAKARGLDDLAKAPWTVRLLRSPGPGASLGEEWGDGCVGDRPGWSRWF
jgi:hypothetical protein